MSAEPTIPALRLVECADCERLQLQLDAVLIDRGNLEIEVRQAKREIGRLKAQVAKDRQNDPNYEVALRLFDFWRVRCNHPKAQFGPERQKVLLARLEFYKPREIAKAILGAAIAAYVDERGARHDDLELICRNEVKLEKFIDRYERRQSC